MKKIYLSLLIFLFILPGEVLAACASSISYDTNVSDNWESSCTSANRSGRYAKYYKFTLFGSKTITINLKSSKDTYLFLLNGSGQNGSVIASNDDISSGNSDSQIIRTLSAGNYTVEATTFEPETTGNFVVSVSTSTPTSGDCINPISFNTNVSGSWEPSCKSSSDRYSKYYTFALFGSQEVTIDLRSSTDTYLVLRSGTGKTGVVIATNHDNDDTTGSRIIRTLSEGNYTVQATTWVPETTGDFVVSVNTSTPTCSDCPFLINVGLNDAWYNPVTKGQGFLITVFPDSKRMFLAWFTFDTERPPEDVTAMLGEPGHRWLTAQGPYNGDTANLTIFVTEGGVFDAAEPAASIDLGGDGTMTLEFADCNEGLAEYEITSLGISGEIPIQRIVTENVPLCEILVDQLQQ